MSETKQLITDLDKKVDQLLSNLREAKASSENREQEIENLKKQLADKDKMVNELQGSESSQVAAEVQTRDSEKGSEAIKNRINELVKEIDNCISLLKV